MLCWCRCCRLDARPHRPVLRQLLQQDSDDRQHRTLAHSAAASTAHPVERILQVRWRSTRAAPQPSAGQSTAAQRSMHGQLGPTGQGAQPSAARHAQHSSRSAACMAKGLQDRDASQPPVAHSMSPLRPKLSLTVILILPSGPLARRLHPPSGVLLWEGTTPSCLLVSAGV